jgi:hypothetical protein
MTTMVAEVYDALVAAGTPDDKARKAAETIVQIDTRVTDIGGRMDRLNGRMDTMIWMMGANLTLTILILGKMLVSFH